MTKNSSSTKASKWFKPFTSLTRGQLKPAPQPKVGLKQNSMQSIIQVFKNGTGRERLATVADILSILGVSLAAVVGGALTLTTNLYVGNVIGAAAISLISLAGAALVLVGFLAVSGWLSRRFSPSRAFVYLFQFALWTSFAALFLFAVFVWYDLISSFRFSK